MAKFMHARSLATDPNGNRVAVCGTPIHFGDPTCSWKELGKLKTPPLPPCQGCLNVIAASGWAQ